MLHIATQDIIDYEEGNLSAKQEAAFFQKLIDTGMAWTLQGHYGRNAERLIKAGRCTRNRKRNSVTSSRKRSTRKA